MHLNPCSKLPMAHNKCHAKFENLSETWKEQDLSTAGARGTIEILCTRKCQSQSQYPAKLVMMRVIIKRKTCKELLRNQKSERECSIHQNCRMVRNRSMLYWQLS